MAFGDVMAGHKFEASGNIGAQRSVSVINEYATHTRGHVIVRSDDGTGGGDYHIETISVSFKAFMLGEMLGKAVGQMSIKRIKRHVLMTGTIRLVAGGAKRPGHYQFVNAVAPGRLKYIDCAANVGIVYFALVSRITFDSRDQSCAMVNAGAAAHRSGHSLTVAQVGVHTLHVKAVQCPVIAFGAHHHPNLLTIVEETADQVRAKMTRAPCNQGDACAHGINPRS